MGIDRIADGGRIRRARATIARSTGAICGTDDPRIAFDVCTWIGTLAIVTRGAGIDGTLIADGGLLVGRPLGIHVDDFPGAAPTPEERG